jgi:hypothetical protein
MRQRPQLRATRIKKSKQINKLGVVLFVRSRCCVVIKSASLRKGANRYAGSNPNHESNQMVEATFSLTQAQRVAQRQAQAVRVLAQQSPIREVKDAIRREGKVKSSRGHTARSWLWQMRG